MCKFGSDGAGLGAYALMHCKFYKLDFFQSFKMDSHLRISDESNPMLAFLMLGCCLAVGLMISGFCLATHALSRVMRVEDAVEDHFGIPQMDPESHIAVRTKRVPLLSVQTCEPLHRSVSDSALCNSPSLRQHIWLTPELRRRKQKVF